MSAFELLTNIVFFLSERFKLLNVVFNLALREFNFPLTLMCEVKTAEFKSISFFISFGANAVYTAGSDKLFTSSLISTFELLSIFPSAVNFELLIVAEESLIFNASPSKIKLATISLIPIPVL